MPGEEPLVLQAWDLIQARYPKALLILAPRHPARFDEVSEDLARAQRSFVRRTALHHAEPALSAQLAASAILVLDTVGELAGVFEVADIVFIGGSLVPTGGHNLLEAAYWSKVIAFGPYMENFRDIAKLFLEAGAAIQVRNPEELAHVTWLLENTEARERLGSSARRVLSSTLGQRRAPSNASANIWMARHAAPICSPARSGEPVIAAFFRGISARRCVAPRCL